MTDVRTTEEVLRHHLACRQAGDLEADLRHNYAPEIVVLTMEGVYRGYDGVRSNAQTLRGYLGGARFTFPVFRIADRFALLEWRAEHEGRAVYDGADSFVVEGGLIVCQTIRYTVHDT